MFVRQVKCDFCGRRASTQAEYEKYFAKDSKLSIRMKKRGGGSVICSAAIACEPDTAADALKNAVADAAISADEPDAAGAKKLSDITGGAAFAAVGGRHICKKCHAGLMKLISHYGKYGTTENF